jgi:hypothetical protein
LKKIFLVLAIVTISYETVISQSSGFSANRPGIADNPDITPAGNLMIEGGLQYSKYQGENIHLLPTTLFRYGMLGNLEIDLHIDNIYQTLHSLVGLAPISLGTKISICEQERLLPKMTFVTAVILPWFGEKSLRPAYLGGLIELVFRYSIKEKSSLIGNLSSVWDGTNAVPVFNYAVYYSYAPVNRLATFVELYGLIPEVGEATFAADGGISYRAAENLQLDFSLGADLINPGSNYFFQIGAAVQIVKRNKVH